MNPDNLPDIDQAAAAVPHPSKWKLVRHRPAVFTMSVTFDTEDDARTWQATLGGDVLPPSGPS